ncbi:MAG: hypothetical protein ACRECO_04330 [Xanthobacteraceae bacterium]
MNTTLLLAVYGALLSTILGFIAIFNFFKERQILSVEHHLSYGESTAYYNFVISNISSRPFTIIDCSFYNLSKTERGDLQPDWGIEPQVLSSLFGNEETKKLVLPQTLHPGAILIIGIDSEEIVDQFSVYAGFEIGTEKWAPTEGMQLAITHSMSKRTHVTKFKLEENELQRYRRKNEK